MAARFGVGEWYGYVVSGLQPEQRRKLFALQQAGVQIRCPFRSTIDGVSQPCNKIGGVCSFRAYEQVPDGHAQVAAGEVGKLRVACPNRFLGSEVESTIGSQLIHTTEPLVIGEVAFLTSEAGNREVGRIDLILMNPDHSDWCAVEHQAVYFSGLEMSPEFRTLAEHTGPGLPMPVQNRRPDYRSSGPKRLMPQLQIKVPTLRRWGKKMAVVVDESFFAAMGTMELETQASNADIAWIIVELVDEGFTAKLKVKEVKFATLERAVEGLTAGRPVTKEEFERRILEKLAAAGRKRKLALKRLQQETPHHGL